MDPLTGKVAARYVLATETLTVYHGTNSPPFEKFNPSMRGTATDDGELGSGFYLSTDPRVGRTFKTLLQARVQLRKPLLLSFPKWEADKRRLINEALGTNGLKGSAITSELKRQGYDGVILDYSPVGYHQKEVMAIHPSQVDIVGPVEKKT